MADQDDPVRAELGGRDDLQNVAAWERRSVLDWLAVVLYGFLHAVRKWALVALGIVLFVVQVGVTGFLVIDEPIIGALAALSVLPALALVAYIWYSDPTIREPVEALAITFVLAFVFASLAAVANTFLQIPFQFVPVVGTALYFLVVVGPVEEAVKLLAVRTYAFRTESFNTVVDGAVYGAVAGLGFATIENLIYITRGYVQAASVQGVGPLELATGTAARRAFVGPGHVLYSAFAGYYLGIAKFDAENAGPIVVKGLLIAAGIHAIYNTLVTYLPLPGYRFLAFILVFDGIVALALFRKVSQYTSLYKETSAGGRREPATDD